MISLLLSVSPARPAFDCRGSITIAFVKNNRMITVKIEHTPFHKTVADLAELFKPPPLPARAEPRRKDGESRKTKRQAAANGAEGPSKKRKKKSVNPDDPNAEGDQAPKPKRPRASRARKAAAARAEGGDQQNTLLNLSPSEAARRRDEATRKLSDNGIDPNTLSTEQFEIFANQSPELQRESLAMLTKYGAERLRIVHPNKDNASPSRPASANGAAVDGSVKKKSKRRTLNEDGTPKVTKTRGSCQSCRAKKMKARVVYALFVHIKLTLRSVPRRGPNAWNVSKPDLIATIHQQRNGNRTSRRMSSRMNPRSLRSPRSPLQKSQHQQQWQNPRSNKRPSSIKCPRKRHQIWARLASTTPIRRQRR